MTSIKKRYIIVYAIMILLNLLTTIEHTLSGEYLLAFTPIAIIVAFLTLLVFERNLYKREKSFAEREIALFSEVLDLTLEGARIVRNIKPKTRDKAEGNKKLIQKCITDGRAGFRRRGKL